jgi:Lon protease-like protein
MKPKYPLIQTFDKLPERLPIHILENALLPGGELPLELAKPGDLLLFLSALKTDQLIGMVQPQRNNPEQRTYQIGCAGRIRQYRERKDGRLNIMLTGVCRYKIVEEFRHGDGYTIAKVDWSDFENDYETEAVESRVIEGFRANLRHYFDRNNMQVDWKVLDQLPIEQVVNNLVLVLNLDTGSKQRLLESPTVSQRLQLLSNLIDRKVVPIRPPSHKGKYVH